MSWALKSERVGRLRKVTGSEFQTVGTMKLKERSPTDLRLRLGIPKSFSLEDQRVCGSLICAERSQKVRGKCTVKKTVGKSCDIVFAAEFHRQPMEFIQQWCYRVSLLFLQNEPSFTVLNPLQSTYLFCRQTG